VPLPGKTRMPLTLFTYPKAFLGDTRRLQRNALRTWVGLGEDVEVLVFGDEPGAADAAAEVGARTAGTLPENDEGTPLVSELFRRAEELARHDALCYVNADVLLPPVFPAALGRMWAELPAAVAVGQCRNVEVSGDVSAWSDVEGATNGSTELRGLDYCAFRRGTYADMPPFALGRIGYDNWLVWDARRRGIPVVDLTRVVPAVHQAHDYGHLSGGRSQAYEGPEARRNIALAGGELHMFNINDVTHRLTPEGLRPNRRARIRAFPPARWAALRVRALLGARTP
jgi:hypothetical protein